MRAILLLGALLLVDSVEARAQSESEVAERRGPRSMQTRSNRWRHLCVERLHQIWLPRLRRLTGARVAMKSKQRGTNATIDIEVRQGGTLRGIYLFWDPDECDAGAPTGGWTADGFDSHAPATQLERLLTETGDDCAQRIPW